jgi:predicted nuclease of restriction endonuclease-like (RecB) superfamily
MDRLSHDLQVEFPGVEGFSPRSLKYMRSFAEAWPEKANSAAGCCTIALGPPHGALGRLKDGFLREWYLRAAVEYGRSRNVMVLQIQSGLHEREGKALTNFHRALPPPNSDLAEQILKDPYNFDFLTVSKKAQEREIERGLLHHLRDLLLELGRGFSFVGSQVVLEVGGETFYIDLLFYHLRLHCYLVIELKTGRFKPEWAGKLNSYLSAVDDLMRTSLDGLDHWASALRNPQGPDCRVRLQGSRQAHRSLHLARGPRTPRTPTGRSAVDGGFAGRCRELRTELADVREAQKRAEEEE